MTDHGDPGYLRYCLRPDCGALFSIWTGEGLSDGWRQLTRVVPGYLCPRHATAVQDGGHLPHWDDIATALPGMCGIACACGWSWSPVRPASAGQHADQWIAHLIEVDRALSETPRSTLS